MRNGIVFTILPLFACLVIFSQDIAAGQPLRSILEQAWNSYLKACKSGKESELEKTISSFRLGTMKNNLASAQRSLTPDLIKSIAEDVPDIATAKFLKLMENGPTAGLVYVKDSEDKDASNKPRVTFMFIKFVQENDVWKVDGEMNMGSPKFQKNGKESEFNPSDLPPPLEIDGKVPKSPEQAPVPDISGLLDVSSHGYKTEITINEVEQEATQNKSYSGLLEKGLRKGKNSIVIRFTKTDKETAFKPGVTIRSVTNDGKSKEVFKYEPKDAIEGTHTFTFTADE
jgi:hypothetical protein